MKIPCKLCGEMMEYTRTGIEFAILEHGWKKHYDEESKYLLDRFNEMREHEERREYIERN